MLVFWVNRAVYWNAVSIVECKESCSLFSRSMNFISIHSRYLWFKIMWRHVTCMLSYNYDFGLGSCLSTQPNYSLPRDDSQECFQAGGDLISPPFTSCFITKVTITFLFPNNTHCEIKFHKLTLIKHWYHIEGLTKTLLPDQNNQLHRLWHFSFHHLSSLLLLPLLFSSGETGFPSS